MDKQCLKYTTPVLTTREVVGLTKLPYETHQIWLRRKIVRPGTPSPGRGKQRLYSIEDTILFAVLADLNFLNQPPALIKNAALAVEIRTTGDLYFDAFVRNSSEQLQEAHKSRFLVFSWDWLTEQIRWWSEPSATPTSAFTSQSRLVVDLYSHVNRAIYYIASCKGIPLPQMVKAEVNAHNLQWPENPGLKLEPNEQNE